MRSSPPRNFTLCFLPSVNAVKPLEHLSKIPRVAETGVLHTDQTLGPLACWPDEP